MMAQILEWEILMENPVTGCFLILCYDYVRAFVIVIMIVFSKKRKGFTPTLTQGTNLGSGLLSWRESRPEKVSKWQKLTLQYVLLGQVGSFFALISTKPTVFFSLLSTPGFPLCRHHSFLLTLLLYCSYFILLKLNCTARESILLWQFS